MLILDEFHKQDIAMKKFIFFLHGKRKSLFLSKWAEYENKYNEIKSLGLMGAIAAIAPDVEALTNATSNDAEIWENERKINIHKIITELLEISKIKKWF